MTLNEKFKQRVREVDLIGRDLYGTSYVSFWRFMHFIQRSEIVYVDHEELADIQQKMYEDPRLANWN